MSTKINTLKQLRKGDNGTFLGNKDNELKWLTIADLGVKDAAAITEEINNAIEAAKNQLKIDINTAKFVGPVASEAGQEDAIDANDLLLVGDAAPYKIFAKVGGALVELGKTDVDLTNYYTKQEVDQKVEAAKNEAIATAAQDATTKAEQAKQDAITEAERIATEKAEQARTMAIVSAQSEAINQAKQVEARIPEIARQEAQIISDRAKQEAVDEAGRFATGEAERIKNELDPRITALEEKPTLVPSYAVYTARTTGDKAAELAFGIVKPARFNEHHTQVFVNGVKQVQNVDFTYGPYEEATGKLPINFTSFVLDIEDTLEVVAHEFVVE